jgi:flagellar assembly factor FliW
MQIQSTRFGEIDIRDDAVLTFEDGLIGLPGTRYALVAEREESPFYWLHSVEHPDVALPVTKPWLFFPEYEIRVNDEDATRLELESADQADIFCVVRAAEQLEEFTANLAAPVIVHTAKRVGRQVLNELGGYRVRQPLFSEVELDAVEAATTEVPLAAEAV